jgi:plasmid segregation protein ParM
MEEQVRLVDISSQTVRTETLPEGAFFVSPDGVLYRVVMAERAGFRKAEPWPTLGVRQANDDRQPVALVPGSLLARNYSLVAEGHPLPVLSRTDFLQDGQPGHYFFPNESLACWAARLDEALARRSGLAARKERHYWVLSDGQHDFRFYHFQVDRSGDSITLPNRVREELVDSQPCDQGPRYWWHLPGWKQAVQTPRSAEEPFVESGPSVEATADAVMQSSTIFALVERTESKLESAVEATEVQVATSATIVPAPAEKAVLKPEHVSEAVKAETVTPAPVEMPVAEFEPLEAAKTEAVTPAPAEETMVKPEVPAEAVKVEDVTSAPMMTAPVEKTETKPAAEPSNGSVPAETAKMPARRLSWQTLTGCLPWRRRGEGAQVASPNVPVALKRLTPQSIPQSQPDSDSVLPAVETPETPPGVEPTLETVTPLSVERPEMQMAEEIPSVEIPSPVSGVPETPPVTEESSEVVTLMAVEKTEAQTVTAMQLEALIPTEAAEPKAHLVAKSPAQPDEVAAQTKPVASENRRIPRMILSVDIGYGYTKGVGSDGVRFSFPSVIGNAEEVRFSIDLNRDNEEQSVKYGEWTFAYGGHALLQSRIQTTIFDRSRTRDQIYKMLFVAALVEMTKQSPDCKRVKVVTGLPVDFFNDRSDVVKAFVGDYRITTDREFECTVESVYVAPQPFGSLFRELLNERGRIVNSEVERRRIGVIDVGTYTTDFILADELRYVQRLSGSIRIGWSKVINKVQQALSDLYRLELSLHEVDRALQAGAVRVHGEPMPLQPLVAPAVGEIETAVIARSRDLWGEAVDLDTILVTGGGGASVYDAIHNVYPHARLLDSPFWANAEGLQRFGRRPATFEE